MYLCSRKPPRNLTQNAATIRWSNSGRLRYLLNHKSKIFSHLKGQFDSWWYHTDARELPYGRLPFFVSAPQGGVY